MAQSCLRAISFSEPLSPSSSGRWPSLACGWGRGVGGGVSQTQPREQGPCPGRHGVGRASQQGARDGRGSGYLLRARPGSCGPTLTPRWAGRPRGRGPPDPGLGGGDSRPPVGPQGVGCRAPAAEGAGEGQGGQEKLRPAARGAGQGAAADRQLLRGCRRGGAQEGRTALVWAGAGPAWHGSRAARPAGEGRAVGAGFRGP